MSERDLKPVDSGWQAQQVAAPYLGHDASKAGAPAYYFEDHQQQPSLRTHKSLPYSLAASNAGVIGQGSVSSAEGTRRRQSGKESRESTGHPQTSFGGSAPASPASRVSPRSPGQDDKDAPGDEEDLDFAMEEGEGEDDDGKPQSQMTAAEIRNQKRKMKRFRLTHSQTRFLMSEFARQAHPDAAHRERLSREIPGLSPRQVQVWFQNRRAKLKRLTTEDRERMMKSRQLPDDFDMSHTLHSGYGAGSSSGGVTPHASPANYPPAMQHPGGIRPLTLDTLRRGGAPEQSYVSPTGVSPALDSLAFTPPIGDGYSIPYINSQWYVCFRLFTQAARGQSTAQPVPWKCVERSRIPTSLDARSAHEHARPVTETKRRDSFFALEVKRVV
ncbi:hypothetical protein H2203_007340 [Taxawa tesnikishii (nom. ined.)]|nr:hypothetical protein H2203_007340 [Dothideales sp. JES 119]